MKLRDMSDTKQPIARLIWRVENNDQERLLKSGDIVTMGRGENNIIVINSPKISRTHARIEWAGDRFTIQDLGSSNGTFVNYQRIGTLPIPLMDGDEIGLETVIIKYQTIVLAKAVQHPSDITTVPGVLIHRGDAAHRIEKSKVYLEMNDRLDKGHIFNLTSDFTTIGRSSQNADWEIQIDDHTISRPHARIERKGVAFYIIDVGSANGTLVNDLFVIEPILLKDGDVIQLGETRLVFHSNG